MNGVGRRMVLLLAGAAGGVLFALKATAADNPAPASAVPPETDRTAALEREVKRLRLALQEKEEALSRMRIWLGGAADSGSPLAAGDREARQLRTMETLSARGIELVLKAEEVSRQLRGLLKPLTPAERAQILLRLDELDAAARSFNLAADLLENPRIERCRILSVNPELGVAAVSVGANAGAVPGMIYRKDGLELRLIAVRPYASAAVVQKGRLSDVIPGMEFSSGEAAHASVVVFGK